MNSPWIDAREQPPKLGEILAVFEGGQRGYLSWGKDDTVFHRKILYWMPIPEVPKPDPFLEWYLRERVQGSHENEMRSAWDAGACYALSNLKADDAWTKAPGQRE